MYVPRITSLIPYWWGKFAESQQEAEQISACDAYRYPAYNIILYMPVYSQGRRSDNGRGAKGDWCGSAVSSYEVGSIFNLFENRKRLKITARRQTKGYAVSRGADLSSKGELKMRGGSMQRHRVMGYDGTCKICGCRRKEMKKDSLLDLFLRRLTQLSTKDRYLKFVVVVVVQHNYRAGLISSAL